MNEWISVWVDTLVGGWMNEWICVGGYIGGQLDG